MFGGGKRPWVRNEKTNIDYFMGLQGKGEMSGESFFPFLLGRQEGFYRFVIWKIRAQDLFGEF
jgi:hypothetical protein